MDVPPRKTRLKCSLQWPLPVKTVVMLNPAFSQHSHDLYAAQEMEKKWFHPELEVINRAFSHTFLHHIQANPDSSISSIGPMTMTCGLRKVQVLQAKGFEGSLESCRAALRCRWCGWLLVLATWTGAKGCLWNMGKGQEDMENPRNDLHHMNMIWKWHEMICSSWNWWIFHKVNVLGIFTTKHGVQRCKKWVLQQWWLIGWWSLVL